ncbi:MAG: histidine kinase [Rhodospirillales bacterium]|nr:histidine kinase [Rhodospirillales bacterium]
MSGAVVIGVAFAYLCLLFAIAYWGDKRADARRSLIAHPAIYALSIAVYCTSWTFYGSVGRATQTGVGFLPIYLGPTLMAALWWLVLRKMVRISKTHRITSIADFVSSRYGKSTFLSGLVTVIAVIGIMPYISLQLKAVSASFTALVEFAAPGSTPGLPLPGADTPFHADTALYVAAILAAFAILFGTRHIDASEHHEGMVAAIAFESIVKLLAFLAVGLFVAFGLFAGPGDIFRQAAERPDLARLFTLPDAGAIGDFVALTLLSMLVILCLPRQFQVSVVECVDEVHIKRAMWLFPLYLLLINLFVLPIAFGGLLTFQPGTVHPDLFVLALPLSQGHQFLALFAFIGGLSAATGMIIVETVALATMVCNDLVMPVLLRIEGLNLAQRRDLSRLLLAIRRWTIVVVVLLGYLYVRLIGQSFALVTIGLVSFAAAAQFAPVLLGGIFWRGATRAGAVAGLMGGFGVWLYTLLLPSFARSGWLPVGFVDHGLFGFALLKPYALFGLSGLDPITHSLIWSLIANLGFYIAVSLASGQGAIERIQAALFVDVFRPSGEAGGGRFWRGTAPVADLQELVGRFVGEEAAARAFALYAAERGLDLALQGEADADLVNFAERILAGAIGAASARVMVASVAKGEVVGLQEVMEILDEASQILAYSQKLEMKSKELEQATAELTAANERLKELDRLKDDFVSTITHELRTPLTSIRSFSEILHDNPELALTQRQEFLRIVISESERLTRLINQVLDLAKIEAGSLDWDIRPLDVAEAVRAALTATQRLAGDKGVTLTVDLEAGAPPVPADRDRLIQVMVNLLSNAVKFAPPDKGRIAVTLATTPEGVRVSVADNGPGIPADHHEAVFDKFRQVGDTLTEKPEGSGLGLAISRTILEHLGGRIWVESRPGEGATFSFVLPRAV